MQCIQASRNFYVIASRKKQATFGENFGKNFVFGKIPQKSKVLNFDTPSDFARMTRAELSTSGEAAVASTEC